MIGVDKKSSKNSDPDDIGAGTLVLFPLLEDLVETMVSLPVFVFFCKGCWAVSFPSTPSSKTSKDSSSTGGRRSRPEAAMLKQLLDLSSYNLK